MSTESNGAYAMAEENACVEKYGRGDNAVLVMNKAGINSLLYYVAIALKIAFVDLKKPCRIRYYLV